MQSSSAERRLAEEIASLKKAVRDLQLAPRLDRSSVEGGSTEVYDRDDNLRQIIGEQEDGSFTTVDVNGPPPPAPFEPWVEILPGLLVVHFDGDTADSAPWPADVKTVRLHADYLEQWVDTEFAIHQVEVPVTGGTATFAIDTNFNPWYVTAVAVNTSGVWGTASVIESYIVPPPATGAGGVATYRSADEPLGLGSDDEGALWYDTDRGDLPHRWDGSAWIAMPVRNDAISDRNVNPKKMIVNTMGGPLANLVHDPDFTDVALNAEREAQDPRFSIITVPDAFAGTPEINETDWTFGPNVSTDPGGGGIDVYLDFNGVSPGDLMMQGTFPLDAGFAGAGGVGVGGPVMTAGSTDMRQSTYRVTVEALDSGGAVVGSTFEVRPFRDFAWDNEIYGDLPPLRWALDVECPDTATDIRISFEVETLDHDIQPVTENQATRIDGDFIVANPYGTGSLVGENLLEMECVPTETNWFYPIEDYFPVAEGTAYTASWQVQLQNDDPVTSDLSTHMNWEWIDAAGNIVSDGELDLGRDDRVRSQDGFEEPYVPPGPYWRHIRYTVSPPPGAVAGRPNLFVITSGGGTVRCRAPFVATAGYADRGTGHVALLTPSQLFFGRVPRLDVDPSGGEPSFSGLSFEIDPDTGLAVTRVNNRVVDLALSAAKYSRGDANQNIGTGWGDVLLNVEDYDLQGDFTITGFTDVTVPEDAVYFCSAQGSWASGNAGRRGLRILAGSMIVGLADGNVPAGGGTTNASGEIFLPAGSVVKLQAIQSGQPALALANTFSPCFLTVRKVGTP